MKINLPKSKRPQAAAMLKAIHAMESRVAAKSGTPMVNYGAAIACVHGILERSLRPLMRCGSESRGGIG